MNYSLLNSNLKFHWLLLIFVWLGTGEMLHAAPHNVIVKGKAPQYAGYQLILETYSNFITRDKNELARFIINPDGQFYSTFHIDEPLQAFVELGKYKALIYLEPGKTFQLELPPFAPRKDEDRFNPYFRHEEVFIGILNAESQELNRQIQSFDEDFTVLFNASAFDIFNKNQIEKATNIQLQLDSIYPSEDNSFFHQHKSYRYAKLYMLALKRQKKEVISRYYSHQPVQYQMPAYWDTFSELFKDFFNYYFISPNGKNLKSAFSSGASFDSLSVVLGSDSTYKEVSFRETLLLKALYDAYYSGNYSETTILKSLSQAAETGQTVQTRNLALQLGSRLTKLKTGTKAPGFNLYAINGKEKTLEDYKGKFVYLNFANSKNYTCRKDWQALVALARDYKKELAVVTITTDENTDALANYIKQYGFKWDFLNIQSSGKVLSDYNIHALPTYYLIDPDGNLLLSPAPSPSENFVSYMLEAMKTYKQNKARKAPEQQKSIYDF
jgi:peroxiredoxin